jgi:hypothetical protein
MAANATAVREVFADLTSSVCDSEESPEALLQCFDAAESIVISGLTPKLAD